MTAPTPNQSQLPFDKNEYSRRLRAIESLSFPALSEGQAKSVRFFLKFIFKHKRSSCDGVMTFVRTDKRSKLKPGQFSLALEMERSKRALENWIDWAKDAGVVDTLVDCDEDGVRRTTLEFNWSTILALSKEDQFANALTKVHPVHVGGPDQSASYSNQSASSTDQSASSTDQSAPSALSLIPITNNQPPLAAVDVRFEILVAAGVNPGVAKSVLKSVQPDPQQVTDVLLEYEGNKALFRGPGAIVTRLRTGYWPADDVISAAKLRERRELRRKNQERLRSMSEPPEETPIAPAKLAQWRCIAPREQERFARSVLDDFAFQTWKRNPEGILLPKIVEQLEEKCPAKTNR